MNETPTPIPTPPDEPRSEGSLGAIAAKAGDVGTDLGVLVRQHAALAKAEVRESAKEGGVGAGLLVAGAMAAHLMLMFLSMGLWWGIGKHTGWGWSGLIVGAVWLVIATVCVLVGRSKIDAMPRLERTLETMKRLPDALRGRERTAAE